MPFIKIKPAIPTNIVRHPNNMRLLKAEGEEVDHNSYWERRLKDGDVVIVETSTDNVNENDNSKDAINRVSTKNKKSEDNT